MDVEAVQQPSTPEFRDVAYLARSSANGDGPCGSLATRVGHVVARFSSVRQLRYDSAAPVALAAHTDDSEGNPSRQAERRGGDKPALVEFDLNPRDFAYRTDGGVAVADRYLLVTH